MDHRFNPFSTTTDLAEGSSRDMSSSSNQHLVDDPFSANPTFAGRVPSSSGGASTSASAPRLRDESGAQVKSPSSASKYTTSFPDPFGDTRPSSASSSSIGLALSNQSECAGPPASRDAPQSPPWHQRALAHEQEQLNRQQQQQQQQQSRAPMLSSSKHRPLTTGGSNRSNSVMFASQTSIDKDDGIGRGVDSSGQMQTGATSDRSTSGARQTSGLGSFLSRATSVTSSTVTDRVSGAVGSVRSAVDSISNQIQSAVPNVNLTNERLSSTDQQAQSQHQQQSSSASLLQNAPPQSQQQQQQQQQQLSAASYLASKLTSAASSAASSSQQLTPVISRQRVVLVLDSPGQIDWPLQFVNYRRVLAGLNPISSSTSSSSTLTSFFTSATAQFSSSAALLADGADLIEQVDYRDVSVLANQTSCAVVVSVRPSAVTASSTASASHGGRPSAILMSSSSGSSALAGAIAGGGGGPSSSASAHQVSGRIIRPEYVVVRQRATDSSPYECNAKSANQDHLRNIVKALEYCSVPIYESFNVWHVFQDRQMIFSHLLRVQKSLGKENFPLIPQVYCQTGTDLLNYIANSQTTIPLPCLLRIGSSGYGRIRCDSLQMLRELATILTTNNQSCTLEQFLDVKCDLIVQKIGDSLKLFKRSSATPGANSGPLRSSGGGFDPSMPTARGLHTSASGRPMATRQSSLSSSMLSSLISGSSQQQQQQQQQQQSSTAAAELKRRSSQVGPFERLSEVSFRYRNWIDAITREFANSSLDAFYLKISVATNDREYIVGMGDCTSMKFLGSQENQDEDKRSLVELIVGHMNATLSKQTSTGTSKEPPAGNRNSSDWNYTETQQPLTSSFGSGTQTAKSLLTDKKAYSNEPGASVVHAHPARTPLATGSDDHLRHSGNTTGGSRMLGNARSKSVSMSQNDSLDANRDDLQRHNAIEHLNSSGDQTNRSIFHSRRSSERSDSLSREDQRASSTDRSFESSGSSKWTGNFHQRQSSLGQSFFDQTSTALSSFQKQSLSFFKRLDLASNTPPQSAKSDSVGFEQSLYSSMGHTSGPFRESAVQATGEIKSQSVDNSGFTNTIGSARVATGGSSSFGQLNRDLVAPLKPPPPQNLMNRQSSLQTTPYSSKQRFASTATSAGTPANTRQNSSNTSGSMDLNRSIGGGAGESGTQRTRVVRQNSALSAFEPFDNKLRQARTESSGSISANNAGPTAGRQETTNGTAATELNNSADRRRVQQTMDTVQPGSNQISTSNKNFDSASMTSAESNETATAEDTMNNLKKTFASIFGHE